MEPTIRLKPNDTIVFTGDSITAAERHRQAYAPLGFGYVHFAGNLLLARHPSLNLRIANTGISGDTVIDLRNRWQRDCIAHRPNVLSILVGINDIWQLRMEPHWAQNAATPHEYEVTYEQLVAEAKKQCECKLVLMEPFLFCRDRQDEVFKFLAAYVEVTRRLAARHEAVLVSLQSQIDLLIGDIAPEKWSADMVHPYLWVHAWIAQKWLDATGL